MIGEVYKVVNRENGKIYVGITNQGVVTRWHKHCSDGLYGNSNFPIHNAIRKYGRTSFKVEVIEEVIEDYDQLKKREIYWIKFYKSFDRKIGYNLTLGGDGTFGRFHSEETKDKIRQKAIGRKRSDETRLKMSMSLSKNKIVTQFTLNGESIKTFRSVREAARQVGCNPTNIAACARGQYKQSGGFKWSYTDEIPTDPVPIIEIEPKVKQPRVPMSKDVKQRIAETNRLRWKENPERRKQASLNNPKNKPILQYTLDGEFIQEFRNVAEAVKEVNASTHTNIAKCARGIRKTSCGFKWEYKE